MATGVRVNGVPLSAIAPWGDLSWSTNEYGLELVEWTMHIPAGFTHPALRRGATVELLYGTKRIGVGMLSAPDYQAGRFTATGLAREAARFVAVTNDVDDEVAAAISRGLPWNGSTLTGTVAASPTANGREVVMLNQLLDQHGPWMVDEDGVARPRVESTTIDYHLSPSVGALGVTDDGLLSTLYGWFVSGVAGDPAEPASWANTSVSVPAPYGAVEDVVDLTDAGLLDTTSVQDALTTLLEQRGGGELRYTNGLRISEDEITTVGGTRADLRLVRNGQRCRLHGLLNQHGDMRYGAHHDFIIQATQYAGGSGYIDLTPVGMAERANLADLATAVAVDTRERRRRRGLL